MIPPHVLEKMRAALLLAGATGATCSCTRGKAAAETADATSSVTPVADGATFAQDSTDASADANGPSDAGAVDASDDDDMPDGAPFGTVACPIHGSHPKLSDGGVVGVVNVLNGTGGVVLPGRGWECGGCGMGGISRNPGLETIGVAGPKGDVSMGAVVGAPDGSDVYRVVAGTRPRMRACYNKGLEQDPTMAGKLVLSVTFGPNGEVTKVDVVSNTGLSQSVASCVTRVLRNMQSRSGGATVSVPLMFVKQG
jgi:hypothetical protein